MKPFNRGGSNSVLIPAITEYPFPRIEHFDHYNIDQIWTRIDIYNGEDILNWERITDRSTVQTMPLHWLRKHFEKSNQTQFATEEWRIELQDYHIQQMLLDGSYPIPQDLPIEAQEILQSMRRPPQLDDDIQDYTTVQNFREYIKKMMNAPLPPPAHAYMVITKHFCQLMKNIYLPSMASSKCYSKQIQFLTDGKKQSRHILKKRQDAPSFINCV